MKKIVHNFIHCGILGWCLEIIFTAFHSFRKKEYTLKGNTSIFMFPIYGMAAFLSPFFRLFKGKPIWIRGPFYALCIFTGEYATGYLLRKKDLCPWDYSHSKWNVDGLIRLDYFPFWIVAGLLFERLIAEEDAP